MEAIAIYQPFIYSIKYDEKEENEYDLLFQQWNDMEYVIQFFESNKKYLQSTFWCRIREPEAAAQQVIDEAEALEVLFDELADNAENGRKPDFDSHFKYLEGKYQYELEWQPMKSYGPQRPSLLRIYAIKLDANTYLITGGGIKLADKIQNSPDLKDHVLQNIDRVRRWLKENGIMDGEDIIEPSK